MNKELTIRDELILLAKALDEDVEFSNDETIVTVLDKLRPIILLILTKANDAHITFKLVEELPTEDIKGNVIYLLPNESETGTNVYDEYMYIEENWEIVGTTKANVDAKEDVANKVTSISNESTDVQYPSAKCVYDTVGDIEGLLQEV